MRKLLVVVLLAACHPSDIPDAGPGAPDPVEKVVRHTGEPGVNPRLLRRFKPLRAVFADGAPPTVAQIDLGRQLFFDTRLSKDGDLSCNSCHALDKYGVDGQATSAGTKGQRGKRNSPTVYQAAGSITNFWDGRASSVEKQALGPILNPIEMGMASAEAAVAVLVAIPGYVEAFHIAFPDETNPVTYDNLGRAIGAFERKLVTPSRWDRYLEGDQTALTAEEISGLKLFTDIGCITCHTGELVGGSIFQKAGAMKPWPNQADRGRFEVTKLPADLMLFKVPSLRDVAKTAPYFHDGSVATLSEAVRMMAHHQLDEDLPEQDVRSIVVWLGSLTGDLPTDYIKPPVLPPDGPVAASRAR